MFNPEREGINNLMSALSASVNNIDIVGKIIVVSITTILNLSFTYHTYSQ